MKFRFTRRSKHISDNEFVEQTRRWIVLFDRARPWLLALYIAALLVVVCLLISGLRLLVALNVPFVLLGFCTGGVVGLAFSWMFHGILSEIGNLLNSLRAERLLVKYYDALVAVAEDRLAEDFSH